MEELCPPPPPTLTELVSPPPAGVAPLDQFREALLQLDDALGRPHEPRILSSTNAELLLAYRREGWIRLPREAHPRDGRPRRLD